MAMDPDLGMNTSLTVPLTETSLSFFSSIFFTSSASSTSLSGDLFRDCMLTKKLEEGGRIPALLFSLINLLSSARHKPAKNESVRHEINNFIGGILEKV